MPSKASYLIISSYDRIMKRLLDPNTGPQSRASNIRMLLGWLACTKRPLKWYEMQGAVTIDLDTGQILLKRHFREDYKDLCASLVEISSD